MKWSKGRGIFGFLEPLLGKWVSNAGSDMGPVECRRIFTEVLDGKYLDLSAHWAFETSSYEEKALFGVGDDKKVKFWSFTSDGKHSSGVVADVTDLHPNAIGFEAQLKAGLARQVYWPHPELRFNWAVESHTKKGWKRFVRHHYKPA